MIFVDSDAFIGMYLPKYAHNDKANKLFNLLIKKNVKLITSWDVLDEVATKLSYIHSKTLASKFLSKLLNSDLEVVYPGKKLGAHAIKIFNKQTSKKVSLTDCTNMAIMKDKKIKKIFSFDKHYEKNGFKLLK